MLLLSTSMELKKGRREKKETEGKIVKETEEIDRN